MCRPIAPNARLASVLDRIPFIQVPDETRMKQYPFPCENVVKQIAGINALANNGVATDRSRPQMARFFGAVRVMPRSDQETVLHALEHARRIVGKCIAGQRDATRTVERLLTVIDEVEIVDALDRMKRRRILRLGRLTDIGA